MDLASAVRLNVLSSAELLAHDRPAPTAAMWTGAYVDAWLLVPFVRRADAKRPGPDSSRAAAVSKAYVDAGRPEKPKTFH